MKITINKSAKRVLSLTLAFVMLLGSLFIANVGINFDVDAATDSQKTFTSVWSGNRTKPANADTAGSSESDPIIIKTADELAWVFQSGNGNSGKYYKVDDSVKAFYLDADVTENTDWATAKATLSDGTARNWSAWANYNGHFDGNGAIVAGMYSSYFDAGFIFRGQGSVKNLKFINCYSVSTQDRAGVIFGCASGAVTIENCSIVDCYVDNSVSTARTVGIFGGDDNGSIVTINNCFAKLSKAEVVAAEGKTAGMLGNGWNGSTKYTNCIVLGVSPINTTGVSGAAKFTNCYSDSASSSPNVKSITEDGIKGVNAKVNMSALAWGTQWFEVEGELPTPIKPYGYTALELPDIWDGNEASSYAGGDGSKESPYIIETPEQLYHMAKTGGKEDGAAKYYKVADGIDTLYLSDNIGADAETIKTAAEALANDATLDWSKEDFALFAGNFDGNGVTISGMISKRAWNDYTAQKPEYTYDGRQKVGLLQGLATGAVVKNINFDGCYAYGGGRYSALLATSLENYDESSNVGTILIHNISVVNSTVSSNNAGYYAGIISANTVPDMIQINNCFVDGVSCNITHGELSTYPVAGIYNADSFANNFVVRNCVSIGLPAIPSLSSITYNDYSNPTLERPVFVNNVYSVSTDGTSLDVAKCPTDISVNYDDVKADLIKGLPLLDWATGWQIVTTKDGRNIPMPTVRKAADALSYADNGMANITYDQELSSQGHTGADIGAGAYESGTYGYYYKFEGFGTEKEPYLIKNGLDLARAIGCGGVNIDQKLHFKLTNDIDLSGFQWLSGVENRTIGTGENVRTTYKYVPFKGVLDGDGHTVTGLYAAAGNPGEASTSEYKNEAALVPVVDGGTIKNIHIRNAHAGSAGGKDGTAYAGALFAATKATTDNPTVIDGCSVEDCTVVGTTHAVTDNYQFTNTYYVQGDICRYYKADGSYVSDPSAIECDGTVWYKGGAEGSTPKLVNHAASMPFTDVDGDGLGYELNGTNDLTALRNKLLLKPNYAAVYGDVNADGQIDIGDLAILKREMAQDYADLADGFWRNLELGKVEIFYGENDNYDAARQVEIYLEMLTDVDIIKNVSGTGTVYQHTNDGKKDPDGAKDGKFDVIVGDIPGTEFVNNNRTANTYSYSYENSQLWIQGENFTAVEQAVFKWIADSYNKRTTEDDWHGTTGTLSEDKLPVTVNGKTYYYAWGDEFEGVEADKTGLNRGNWFSNEAHSGSTYDTKNDAGQVTTMSKYSGIENVMPDEMSKLVSVEGGKLTIRRGYSKTKFGDLGSQTDYVALDGKAGDNNGYKILPDNTEYFNAGTVSTDRSMLFKQGYIEFMAAIPADGHSFPALWLNGKPGGFTNRNSGWDDSLYSKIYKLNNAANNSNAATRWNGSEVIGEPYELATYKYQVPSVFYELDIMEVMQESGRIGAQIKPDANGNFGYAYTGSSILSPGTHYYDIAKANTTAVGYYEMGPTVHKWYTYGMGTDGKFYTRDWAIGKAGSGAQLSVSADHASLGADTYSFGGDEIGKYSSSSKSGYYTCDPTTSTNQAVRKELEQMRKYGFLWEIDGDNVNLTLYIYDKNDTNRTAFNTCTIPITAITEGDDTSNVERLNSYLYILMDNEFYSVNDMDGAQNKYTDILSTGAKSTMEIEYVRLYQLDGRKDIVTSETEAFNNGNHFGY